ncbi:unnamed protein product, partial [Sphacelaria rigidula]
VLTTRLWGYLTPWLRYMVDEVVRRNLTERIGEDAFVGIHVRRGDLIALHQAHAVEPEEYLRAARAYYLDAKDTSGIESIKGMWIASTNHTVVD